jgi:hypothetical protein
VLYWTGEGDRPAAQPVVRVPDFRHPCRP